MRSLFCGTLGEPSRFAPSKIEEAKRDASLTSPNSACLLAGLIFIVDPHEMLDRRFSSRVCAIGRS